MEIPGVTAMLNDLITLNKNRVTGYKEALHALKQKELADLCRKMIHQSEAYIHELSERIKETGGVIEDKTTTSSVIYNAWMDIVYSESPEPPEEIYDYCRQMEETTVKGYETALKKIEDTKQKDFTLVVRQKKELDESFISLKKVKQ